MSVEAECLRSSQSQKDCVKKAARGEDVRLSLFIGCHNFRQSRQRGRNWRDSRRSMPCRSRAAHATVAAGSHVVFQKAPRFAVLPFFRQRGAFVCEVARGRPHLSHIRFAGRFR
jgi:hypothetical protein